MIVVGILFIATLTHATLGFGTALVSMPLLVPVIGVRMATPLVGFAALTTTLLLLWRNRSSVDLRAARRLIVASAAGLPFGLYLLTAAPARLVIGMLGGVLVAYGVYGLARPTLPAVSARGWIYGVGIGAGALGAAYNIYAPPVVLLGALLRWSPDRFRATVQGYFAVTGAMIWLIHGLSGLWTLRVVSLYAGCLPVIGLGIWLGSRLAQRISVDHFERILYGVLVILGLLLIA